MFSLHFYSSETTVDIILEAKASGVVHGVKLYPKGATTNSENGVTKIENIFPVLTAMEQVRNKYSASFARLYYVYIFVSINL